jgi:hypothetical protein
MIEKNTHLKFTRKLVTKDKFDAQFFKGNKTTIVFGFATVKDEKRKHLRTFIRRNVDLFEPGKAPKPPSIFPFQYLAFGILLLVFIILAIVHNHFIPFLSHTLYVSPKNKILNYFLFHFVQLTYGEIIIIFFYTILSIVWVVHQSIDAYFVTKQPFVFSELIVILCRVFAVNFNNLNNSI